MSSTILLLIIIFISLLKFVIFWDHFWFSLSFPITFLFFLVNHWPPRNREFGLPFLCWNKHFWLHPSILFSFLFIPIFIMKIFWLNKFIYFWGGVCIIFCIVKMLWDFYIRVIVNLMKLVTFSYLLSNNNIYDRYFIVLTYFYNSWLNSHIKISITTLKIL